MAQEQRDLDQREVQKVKAAVRANGRSKAASRFNEHSPEYQQAMRDLNQQRAAGARARQRAQSAAVSQQPTAARPDIHTHHDKKAGDPMAQAKQQQNQQQPPAAQRSQRELTSAEQEVVTMRRQQIQAKQRRHERNAHSQQQGHGQGM